MATRLLVTGSSGLIGSEVVDYFCRLGWDVHGVNPAAVAISSSWCWKPRCSDCRRWRFQRVNIGGGRSNSTSILEAFDSISTLTGKPMRWEYDEKHRAADHICYISDLSKATHYPGWDVSKSLEQIFVELFEAIAVKTR